MRRLILVCLGLAPVIGIGLLLEGHPAAAVMVVFASHMLALYPTLRATSSWLGPVVTRFTTSSREVWLTIDDGPDPTDTPALLELLAEHQARATFFVKGERIARYPHLARAIVDAGHTLGNHSWSHPSGTFWCLPPGRLAGEIDRCNEAVATATGSAPRWFRAPVGMKNPFVHPLLEKRSMPLIAWSSRGYDGVAADPATIVGRIERSIRPGAIVLLHEGRVLQDGSRPGIEVMRRLLRSLEAQGYRAVLPPESSLV